MRQHGQRRSERERQVAAHVDAIAAFALDAEIALEKRDTAIVKASADYVPLRVIAHAAGISHETVRRVIRRA